MDFPIEEWPGALAEAAAHRGPWTTAFLLGMPNAAGQLEEELSIFGFSRADGRRTPQSLFDNWLENMLKTCQDRLVRTVHGPPEGLFFLFPADLLEFTNRASRKGAD
ncbi:MAG: hypothetical protein ACR2KT_04710 [Methylocella sp.]